jgi:hypothetical protein
MAQNRSEVMPFSPVSLPLAVSFSSAKALKPLDKQRLKKLFLFQSFHNIESAVSCHKRTVSGQPLLRPNHTESEREKLITTEVVKIKRMQKFDFAGLPAKTDRFHYSDYNPIRSSFENADSSENSNPFVRKQLNGALVHFGRIRPRTIQIF